MPQKMTGIVFIISIFRRKFQPLILILSLFACQFVGAGTSPEGLKIWHIQNGPRLVFPKVKDEEFNHTLERYVQAFGNDHRYFSITNGDYRLPEGKVEDLRPQETGTVRLAVISNNLSIQKDWDGGAVDHLDRAFEEHGTQSYLIPLGLDSFLTDTQMNEFRQLLIQNFDALLAAGGADVDPSLYGQENRASGNPNFARDAAEIVLIRTWVDARKPFVGICRGQQIGGVALGLQLIQDIPSEVPNLTIPHSGSGYYEHPVTLSPANEKNILFRIVKAPEFPALATHHQAVQFKPIPGFFVTATTEGITEGIQSEDEKILMMQFHPEETRGPVGEAIMNGIVEHLRSQISG